MFALEDVLESEDPPFRIKIVDFFDGNWSSDDVLNLGGASRSLNLALCERRSFLRDGSVAHLRRHSLDDAPWGILDWLLFSSWIVAIFASIVHYGR